MSEPLSRRNARSWQRLWTLWIGVQLMNRVGILDSVQDLGGVVSIDSDVLRSQVRSDECRATMPATQSHPNVTARLGEILMSPSLVKPETDAAFADHLFPDVNADPFGIEGHPTPSHGRQDAPPVGIGPCPRCLY